MLGEFMAARKTASTTDKPAKPARKIAKKKADRKVIEYTLPEKSGIGECIARVFSMDPGSTNYGMAVVEATLDGKVRVVSNSLCSNPVYDLTQFNEQRKAYIAEIDQWVQLYEPSGMVAERFLSRGLQGSLGEYVSCMIGFTAQKYDHLSFFAPMAATWKVPLQKRFSFDLKELYKQCGTTPHQLDACFIGIYALEKGLGQKLDYDPVNIAIQAENTSLVRITQRRRS
jgi:hypothetical protein